MAFEATPGQNNLDSNIRSALADLDEQLHENGLALNILSPDSKLESFDKYGAGDSQVVNAYDYLWVARNQVKEIQAFTADSKTLEQLPSELLESLQNLIIQLQDQGGYEANLAPKIQEWLDKYKNNITEENTDELWSIVRGFHRSLLLSGFVDVRINGLSESGKVIGQEGFSFEKGLSGMTIPIYSIEEPGKPIAVMNFILNSFETYKSTKFIQKTTEDGQDGMRVVGPQAFMGDPTPDFVLTNGWLYFRPDFRNRIAKSIFGIYKTVINSFYSTAQKEGKKIMVFIERDGPDRPAPEELPTDTFISTATSDVQRSLYDSLGKGTEDSKAVVSIARIFGLEEVPLFYHTVPDPYGPIYMADIEEVFTTINRPQRINPNPGEN